MGVWRNGSASDFDRHSLSEGCSFEYCHAHLFCGFCFPPPQLAIHLCVAIWSVPPTKLTKIFSRVQSDLTEFKTHDFSQSSFAVCLPSLVSGTYPSAFSSVSFGANSPCYCGRV